MYTNGGGYRGIERANIKKVRDNLHSFVERAESGEEIVILRRGEEVARLTPPERG